MEIGVVRDINGREVKPGDLIRIYHYRDRRTGRRCYMHRLVVLVDGDFNITPDGEHLSCVDVPEIWTKGIDNAFKHPVRVIPNCEIIGGEATTGELWYERKKVTQESAGKDGE